MSNFYCAYRGCASKSGEGLSLFRFPKDCERSRIWMEACNRQDLLLKITEVHKNYRLCELHFDKKYISKGNTRNNLLPNAVPTEFPHFMRKRQELEENPLEEPSQKVIILSVIMEFEEKVPSNNKTYCCVYGCTSKANRNRTLSFHLFPREGKLKVNLVNKEGICEKIDIYRAWMLKLKMGKLATRYMRVCSLHFTLDDFKINKSGPSSKKLLKWNAVPSVNLPQYSVSPREPNKKKNGKKLHIEMKDVDDGSFFFVDIDEIKRRKL